MTSSTVYLAASQVTTDSVNEFGKVFGQNVVLILLMLLIHLSPSLSVSEYI